MKKLFIIPILFALIFSQSKNNQIYYRIYTDKKVYPNVSIESVYKEEVEVYDKYWNHKLNIPITEIRTLRQIGEKPNIFATIIGTVGGGFSGAIVGVFIDIGLYGWTSSTNEGAIITIASIGAGAMLGYKLGSNIFKRKYKAVDFEGWTLDKKINYLNSIANQ
mgnify:FL=1